MKIGQVSVPLEQVEVCVTSRCNLNCLHCYQHFDKNRFELTFERISHILSFASQKHCKQIVFSGGEFFMHPKAYDILRLARDMGFPKIRIVTNATIIDAERLKNTLSPEGVTLIVSIDGFEPEHDFRRGRGTFRRTISKVQEIVDRGYRAVANVSIDGNNLSSLPKLIKYLSRWFKAINLIPIGYAGGACIHSKALRLHQREIEKVIPLLYQKLSRPLNSERCTVFPQSLSVNYDGTVYPCSVARDFNLFPMGNLNEEAIEDIVYRFGNEEGRVFYDYVSNTAIPQCKTCSFSQQCSKGCRIRAYKWHGSLLAPDPLACRIYRNDWKDLPLTSIYWGSKSKISVFN